MTQNEAKKAASLGQSKYRKKFGLFLVEGVHGVAELLKSRWEIESLIADFASENDPDIAALLKTAIARRLRIHLVNKKILAHIADAETPQGILAVAGIPARDMSRVVAQKRILIADRIADPGNLGALFRSALAFGFGGLISTEGSADIYSPKVVRASQGALFSMAALERASIDEIAKSIKPHHRIFALHPRDGADIRTAPRPSNPALVVGSESSGIGRELLALADSRLAIPMPGPAESLNAAVSAAIAMYEFSRGR